MDAKLPLCSFDKCKYNFDGNCRGNEIVHSLCEYTIALEIIRNVSASLTDIRLYAKGEVYDALCILEDFLEL